MKRIHSGGAFEAKIGYCRAVVAGDWVHVAGTVSAPAAETGEPPTDVVAQCESALAIIKAALAEAGAGLGDVVRVNYYLPTAADFEACWPALRAAFGDAPPAATMVECGLIDPKYKIEIEATAYIG
ncbi:Rid family hydrolase [Thalassobium sp. R2A62]|jgi:enamine deaminase RidA (YjgF/YER057c/UK114 family)|uniref:Rid family hydrolase n=1 Tax=Thalassobium sp. R2A62 TaxID=633131 RepID=UPI0001B1CF76|nr:endoribonuclease L-PSP family protein [Thalassobium sp. R2A62]